MTMIQNLVMTLVPMLLSLTVHEYAHAFAAKKLGDDTAERMGRLNLNPLSHMDPIGTFFLPILLVMTNSGIFFGWAKPVPVNPARFNRKVTMRTGMMITAAAGPASNLILAFLFMGIFSMAAHGVLDLGPAMLELIRRMIFINIGLCLFNLIPVGPLDGQKVVSGLLNTRASVEFERFNIRYGSMLLMGVMMFGGRLINAPFRLVLDGLQSIVGL